MMTTRFALRGLVLALAAGLVLLAIPFQAQAADWGWK